MNRTHSLLPTSATASTGTSLVAFDSGGFHPMQHRRSTTGKDRVPTVPSRRQVLIAGASVVAAPFVRGLTASSQQRQSAGAAQTVGRASQWPSYAGDTASSKYSPLARIGTDNTGDFRWPRVRDGIRLWLVTAGGISVEPHGCHGRCRQPSCAGKRRGLRLGMPLN
jgi:hypothetical protein